MTRGDLVIANSDFTREHILAEHRVRSRAGRRGARRDRHGALRPGGGLAETRRRGQARPGPRAGRPPPRPAARRPADRLEGPGPGDRRPWRGSRARRRADPGAGRAATRAPRYAAGLARPGRASSASAERVRFGRPDRRHARRACRRRSRARAVAQGRVVRAQRWSRPRPWAGRCSPRPSARTCETVVAGETGWLARARRDADAWSAGARRRALATAAGRRRDGRGGAGTRAPISTAWTPWCDAHLRRLSPRVLATAPMSRRARDILVIKLSALGDFVLAMPAFARIRAAHPNAPDHPADHAAVRGAGQGQPLFRPGVDRWAAARARRLAAA